MPGTVGTVLFDLDGTLIDTERYYSVFWREAAAAFGFEMSAEQELSLRSLGRPYAPLRFRSWYGDGFDYIAVTQKRRELMEDYLDAHGGVELKKGARELLEYMKANGFRAAVVTATDPERTLKYLRHTGIDGYFDRVISATMVQKGKPAPDIYLYACEQLGEEPGKCLAAEDAPNGVISAYIAGCRVVMVPDQTGPDATLAPMLYACVKDLSGIIPLLEGEKP